MPHWTVGRLTLLFKKTNQDGPRLYLNKKLPERNIKTHQIPRIRRDNLYILSINILCSGTHRRLNCLARCIQKQLRKPFEDLLNLLRVWFYKIFRGKSNTDVTYAS